ncbi:LysR family transcriptional regulator [Paracoccus sp. (in: a-proteobacteria)]|uniref:LysR family transcriptional regulator n=1 Tax=Paracoccus sp. TaxID=267 RepID=UPI0032202128
MLDYPALLALSEITRRGSFEAAASALGVTPSAVSQRIKGLEERLGEALIHRGPPARGTARGLRLMQHLDQVRLLEQALQGDSDPAHLRLAVNADSLATWFPPVMAALDVTYDLVVDDQDFARDWLRKGEVAAAISSDPDPVPGCDAQAQGRLIPLAPDLPLDIALYWLVQRALAPALAPLTCAIRERAAAELRP